MAGFSPEAGFPAPPAAPVAPSRPFPGFGGGILLVILIQVIANTVAFILLAIVLLARGLPADQAPMDIVEPALLGIVANTLAFGAVIWFTWWRSGRPVDEAFPFRPVHFLSWLPILPTMAGGLLVVNEITNLMVKYMPPPQWVEDIFAEFLGRGVGIPGFIFLVIVAPITEELLFRGVVLNSFVARYGKTRAVVGSAFLFGLIHLIPWQVVPAFILGLFFAWWTVATRSLWPALLAHAFTNAFAFFQGLTHDPKDVFEVTPQPFWLTALGVGLLALGLWWGARVFDNATDPPGMRPESPKEIV